MLKKIIPLIRYLSWLLPFGAFMVGYYGSYSIRQKSVVSTPNLIGKNLKEALSAVSQDHLSMSVFAEKGDAILPEGTVLHQVPCPAQRIRPHQNIFVTISKKPQPCQAPAFLNLKNTDISVYAEKHKKNIKMVVLPNRQTKNICIAQMPEPGKEVGDEKITVYVSSGQSSLFVTPDFRGFVLDSVQKYLQTLNVSSEIFTKDNEILELQGATHLLVVDQKPMAGSLVDLSKPLYMQLQVA